MVLHNYTINYFTVFSFPKLWSSGQMLIKMPVDKSKVTVQLVVCLASSVLKSILYLFPYGQVKKLMTAAVKLGPAGKSLKKLRENWALQTKSFPRKPNYQVVGFRIKIFCIDPIHPTSSSE